MLKAIFYQIKFDMNIHNLESQPNLEKLTFFFKQKKAKISIIKY